MPRNIIDRIRDKFKQHQVLQSITTVLNNVGIQIVPYYITREFLDDQYQPTLDPELATAVFSILSPAETKALFNRPESEGLQEEKVWLLAQNCTCFAIKFGEDIAAYTWVNLQRCYSTYSDFPIKEDEASFCHTVTFKAYRGKNVAPFLRYELYKYLTRIGRTKFYSVTEALNSPAVKFKKKLGARHSKLGLYIGLLNRCLCNITLKKYRIG
jgi:GNAT superfamily N-acetyltransferase